MIYLDLDDIVALTQRAGFTITDHGLVESALARPRASVFGEEAYPGIHEKAAALFQSLATNHALADGNKRTAWAATRLFYGLNDYRIVATENERFDLIIAVATRELSTVRQVAEQLERIAAPM
ncbi:type II toxin-antitoxin system death-on-curing family toxin [Mycolicibacterium sp.]|uniref:type II toxin-antitoxin system death-on-curing family toxin n=1 Tax=Mycolicibacterium sp. TaxID=2320850 RepID=UPI0028AE8E6D|nr:type II toxin-antitoxin system death-on-curing family toxin [Mycolicibacterium sp.]